MDQSIDYSNYLSMKFRYVFSKFTQNYEKGNQFGGYKFPESKENYDLELSQTLTAVYSAINLCNSTPSVDCNIGKPLPEKECSTDNETLSIIASLFLSILPQKGRNFLFEFFVYYLNNKLLNCRTYEKKVEEVKIKEIINYFLILIKIINDNLNKIKNDQIVKNIFLSPEYHDSQRSKKLKQVIDDKYLKPFNVNKSDLDLSQAQTKKNLLIINKFFEKELKNVRKISYRLFLEYLKNNSKFKKITDKISTEDMNNLFIELNTQYNDDTENVDISKLLFIGIVNYDDSILISFTEQEARDNKLAVSQINFLN